MELLANFAQTACPYQSTCQPHLGNPGLCAPGINVLVNEYIAEIFNIYIYIYIYVCVYVCDYIYIYIER